MSPYVGRIVTALCGHDKDRLYLVVGEENGYLFLADGKLSWEGKKEDILHTDNETLNSFLFSSDLVKKVKEMANK